MIFIEAPQHRLAAPWQSAPLHGFGTKKPQEGTRAGQLLLWERDGSDHPRLSVLAYSQRGRLQCSEQGRYLPPGYLYPCSRGSGRRGRRFKSGHPDHRSEGM
jgi:hypothetical protein